MRHHHHCGQRGWHLGGRGGHGGGFGWGMGGGRGGWNPGERGGGGGRRRVFDGGELRLVLLKLIEESPRHGYDLIREIEARSNGAYAPSPGVVYPTLTMLDEMALIEQAQAEGARKAFAITAAGSAELAEKAEEVEALMARLATLGEAQARHSGGPIRRAMGNLRTVLQERVGGSDVEAETLHRIAEILDDAARKIERL